MLELELPQNFKNDIAGRDTALVPVVVIGTWNHGDAPVNTPNIFDWYNDSTFISTNSFSFSDSHEDTSVTINFQPTLLNIPSLKESIDIEKRQYRISNLSIDISNYEYNGQRFSELIGDTSLINTECRVYWWSPSVAIIQPHDKLDTISPYSAFQVFNGTIRRYTHDDEKVRLVIEDRSQATLHKDLPTAELGFGNDVPSKYKGVKIPMVYGSVDRSPCVMVNDENTTQYIVKADSQTISGINPYPYNIIGSSQNLSYLYIFKDGEYSVALSDADPSGASIWVNHQVTIGQHTSFNYADTAQYEIIDNTIVLDKKMRTSVDGFSQMGVNPIGLNHIVCFFRSQVVKSKQYGFNDEENVDGDWIGADGGTSTQNVDVYYDPLYSYTPSGGAIGTGTDWTDLKWIGSASQKEWHGWKMDFSFNSPPSSIDGQYYSYVIIFMHMYCQEASGFGTAHHLDVYTVTNNGDKKMQYPRDFSSDDPAVPPTFDSLFDNTGIAWHGAVNGISLTAGIKSSHGNDASTKIRIDPRLETLTSCYSQNIFVLDNFLDQDYYLDVNGREMANGNSPTAPSAIAHILENELGQSGITVPPDPAYDSWKYAFTVDKKVSSKRLIENIASASPYIPRFDNMGNFKFDVIKPEYNESPLSTNFTPYIEIKTDDIISSSTSRTKIEQVYTKIEFKYNWDYARGKFNSSVTADLSDIPGDYDRAYYGFPTNSDGTYDDGDTYPEYDPDAESTLVIDDDRGKYIRDPGTAQKFATWMLRFYCNQHLKIKIRMPLKAMNVEIGDILRFDKIIDVKPYGISYNPDAVFYVEQSPPYYGDMVNGSQVFPDFMCISTNKMLEFCEIECMQMHNLTNQLVEALIRGCMDDRAWNHNPNAEQNDGSCLLPPYDVNGNEITDGNHYKFDQAFLAQGANACYFLLHSDEESYHSNYPDPDNPIFDDPNINWGDDIAGGSKYVINQDAHRYQYNYPYDVNLAREWYKAEYDPITHTSPNMPILYKSANCFSTDIKETTIEKLVMKHFLLPYGDIGNFYPSNPPVSPLLNMQTTTYQGQPVSYRPNYLSHSGGEYDNFYYIPFPFWSDSDTPPYHSVLNDALAAKWVEMGSPEIDQWNPIFADLDLHINNIGMSDPEDSTFAFSRMTIEIDPNNMTAHKYSPASVENNWTESMDVRNISAEPLIFTSLDQISGDHILSISNLEIKHNPPHNAATEDIYVLGRIWTIDLKITIENEWFAQTGVPESEVFIKVRFGGSWNGMPIDSDPYGWGVNNG